MLKSLVRERNTMTKNVLLSLTSLCLLNLCSELLAQDAHPGFHWPDGKKVAVSLSFDDGRPSQIDVRCRCSISTGSKRRST